MVAGALIKMCFSGKYSEKEVYKKINGNGGTNAYLGTNDMREVQRRAFEDGDEKALLVLEAFTYQVAKDIGAMSAVLKGKVDQIILTGGIAYGPAVVERIRERVSHISDVTVYAGEDELLALTQGALRVITGEETAKEY